MLFLPLGYYTAVKMKLAGVWKRELASVYFRTSQKNKSVQCNSESSVLVQEYIQWNRTQTTLYKDAVRASSNFPFLASIARNWKTLIIAFHKLKFQTRPNFFFFFFSHSLHDKRKRKFHLKILSTTYMLFYINCAIFLPPLSACF